MIFRVKQILSFVLLTIFTQTVLAQEEKTIEGIVTYEGSKLFNVHVVNQTTKKSVKTDAEGQYEIKAKVGEEISFSYVGLKTVKILIEDITSTLNIKMSDEVNELDDVVVKARVTRNKSQLLLPNDDINLMGPFGMLNPEKSGFSIKRINADRLIPGTRPGEALGGKIAGTENANGVLLIRGRRAKYVVDDMPIPEMMLPDFGIVKDIYIAKGMSTVFMFTANHHRYIEIEKKKTEDKYKNKNFYDETSVVSQVDYTQNDFQTSLQEDREVYGTLTYDGSPVSDVLISISGKKGKEVYSDQEGKYKLQAAVGDILQFTHASYETVSVFVEDVTYELNLTLKDQIRELDEVIVAMNQKKGTVVEKKEKLNEKFTTSRGEFDPKKTAFAQSYVDGSTLSNVFPNIQEALVGRIVGYFYDRTTGDAYLRAGGGLRAYPVSWEVDGIFTTYAPPVELSQIKSVRALRSLAATNRYGSQAAGGVIIIETTFGNFNPNQVKKNSFLEEYANSNFYAGDAALSSLEIKEQNKFAQSLKAYKNKYKAFQFYQEELADKITNYGDLISVATEFIDFYQDEAMATTIFNDIATLHYDNPEVLKTLAYYYQKLDNKRAAIDMYERVFKLRPQHAQSFRDLSNAYVDYDQYRKAWKLYHAYMIKGKVTSEEGIGELMYSDMEWLFFRRANQMQFKKNFVPIHRDTKEFKRDVRMVFEWNTSEAEFELEFVSPDRRVYTFDHSLEANNDLIIDEKTLGYSSKMFVIEDLGEEGDWLVNVTYKGNKKTVPTFLKLTTYFNWGKPNEKRDVNVYKLDIQNQKASLLRFDREFDVFEKVAKN